MRLLLCLAAAVAAPRDAAPPSLQREPPRDAETPSLRRREPSSLDVVVAGTLGSMVGEVISYPIDQVKTQCLTQGSSFLVAATTLARQRGVRGVFAGLPSPLVGAFFVKSTVFGAREFWKAVLRRLGVARGAGALSAFGAGAVASLVVAPVERVKIVVQLDGGASAGTQATALRLWRTGALFLGVGATFWREAPQYAAYFSIYESSRPRLSAALAGALAGALSWLMVLPVDAAKTMVQGGLAPRFLPALKTACRDPARLLNGAAPTVMRALVKHGAVFAAYEAILRLLAHEPIGPRGRLALLDDARHEPRRRRRVRPAGRLELGGRAGRRLRL